MKRRHITRGLAILISATMLSAGCVGIDPEARKLLQEPANCSSAQQDTQTLQAAEAHAGKRVAHVVQGVFPVAVVLSLIRDVIGKPYRSIYLDHWRVAFGSYNNQIRERVGELNACSRL